MDIGTTVRDYGGHVGIVEAFNARRTHVYIDYGKSRRWRAVEHVQQFPRERAIADLRRLGWTVFCDEEEDDGER